MGIVRKISESTAPSLILPYLKELDRKRGERALARYKQNEAKKINESKNKNVPV